jgi:hypothetical protein
VEVRHFGISRIGCPELRDNRTTPERDTRTTPERDTRTTSERDTRTTPETHRRGSETNCRGAGTYRRADATRSGPRLHVCGPYTGHRRPFSLHYESLPARAKAKGSDRCITKARAALTDCVDTGVALLGNAGEDFSVAVTLKYPASRNHLVEDRQASCISVIRRPTHSIVIESI